MNLAKRVKFLQLLGPVAGATTTADSALDEIDMAGWDGVCFVATVGVTTSAVNIKAVGSTATGGTFGQLQYNSTSLTAQSTVANRLLVLDVYRPAYRYVKVTHNSTAAGNIAGVMAILYGARGLPSTSGSTDVAAEMHGSGATT
jgi:hypothetical protein